MKTPAIALRRRQDATKKFTHKLATLERLLNEGSLGRFPKRASIASFAAWQDPELGVLPLSRSVIYDANDEYLRLREQMLRLLGLVEKAKNKAGKKGNIETELRLKLTLALERAQDYLNQYSNAKAELDDAYKEIERLNNRLRRKTVSEARITPLRNIRDKPTATGKVDCAE